MTPVLWGGGKGALGAAFCLGWEGDKSFFQPYSLKHFTEIISVTFYLPQRSTLKIILPIAGNLRSLIWWYENTATHSFPVHVLAN